MGTFNGGGEVEANREKVRFVKKEDFDVDQSGVLFGTDRAVGKTYFFDTRGKIWLESRKDIKL